jgi:hypothetical protein
MRIDIPGVRVDGMGVVVDATLVVGSTFGCVRVRDARGAREGDGAEGNADGAFEVLERGDGV